MSDTPPRHPMKGKKGQKPKVDGKPNRDYSFRGLLKLTEDQLRAWFPHGAQIRPDESKKERWEPAPAARSGIGHRTLRDLLYAQQVKPEKPVWLHINPGGSGPRWTEDEDGTPILDPDDDGKHDYTDRSDKRARGEPDVLDTATLEGFAKRNRQRFEAEHDVEMRDMQARQIADKLARLQRRAAKYGLDFAPHLAAFLRDAEAELAQRREDEAA